MMQFWLHVLALASLTSIAILGYNVVLGRGKILHFGQEAQGLTSAYTLWVLVTQYDQPFLFAFLIAAILTAAISLFMAWLSLRLEPDGLGVMTIALHLAVFSIVLNWQEVTRGALGIPGIPRFSFMQSMEMFTLVSVILAIIWFVAMLLLDRSWFGRQLAALSEHPWHAQSLGVSRWKIHAIAFLISGLGGLIALSFFPSLIYLLSPNDYNFPALIFIVMCVIAGKPGSVWGVFLSTFFLIFLKEGLRFVGLPPDLLGPVRLILFGFILFAAIWYRRDTVFPPERKV